MYAGIDPGKHGAIAILRDTGAILKVMPTPLIAGEKGYQAYDLAAMADIGHELKKMDLVAIERQQPMPAVKRDPKTKKITGVLQGGNTIFTTGFGYGLWLMLLQVLEIPHQIVTARKWQAEFFTPQKGKSKLQAFEAARRLFPYHSFRKTKDGEFDAILIAEWGRRKAQGRQLTQ